MDMFAMVYGQVYTSHHGHPCFPLPNPTLMMYIRSQTPKAKNEKMENPGQKICTGLSTAVRPKYGRAPHARLETEVK